MFFIGNDSSVLRPFNKTILDGVDLDIEAVGEGINYYSYFINQLRTLFKLLPVTKSYYISGAPQCPYPDAYLGATIASAGSMIDYLFIQFYNNPYCQINQPIGLDV